MRRNRGFLTRFVVLFVVGAFVPVMAPATAAAAPPVPPLGSAIDGYAAWDDERTCSRWEKPGVAAFKSLLLRTYLETEDWQYFAPCDASNDTGHQQGTAWDWGIPTDQRDDAEELLDWLLATRDGHADALARRFGIMYIIWQDRIWRSYPHNGAPAGTWGSYTGDPHNDHVHFSFGPAGANKRTTWWTGQQHVLATTQASGVHHAMRRTGGWTQWGNVENPVGQLPGTGTVRAGTADVAGELHVLAAKGGELFHAIRRADGWTGWGNVENQTGERGTVTDAAGAGMDGIGDQAMNHDLHVVAATSEGGLFHAVRSDDGWTSFGNVEGQCGALPGTVVQVAAATYRDQLHVLAVTDTSPQRNLYHCIRGADGWSEWGNVENPAGDRGSIADVAAATVGANLHVVITNTDGEVYHTIRSTSGWTAFGYVEGQSGDAGAVTDVGTAGRENGELHVLVTNTAGRVLHTIRGTDGWGDWGDVEGRAGQLPANPVEVTMS